MKFKVERTSEWNDDVPPYDGAIKGTIPLWDYRTCKTPKEFNERKLGDWFGEGTSEHGTYGSGNDRGIKRRREGDATAWYVVVNCLDDLLAFQRKHGDLVLKEASEDHETPTIEIYDGYRE